MKKIITVITCFFALATTVYAQDTMQYMDPCYLFNERHPYTVYPWGNIFERPIAFPPGLWGWDKFCSKPYMRMHDCSYCYPLNQQQESHNVYGVALTLEGYDRHILTDKDMLNYPYDVIIAQAVNNELIILDSTTWDTEKDAIEYFRYSMMGDDGVLYEHIIPIYEFYFDTAHLVTDTFYVGFRLKVPYLDSATIDMRFLLNCSVDSVSTIWVYNDDLQLTRGRHNYVWGGEFPILQPNRRCHTPTSAPQIIIYNATNTVRFTLPYETGDSLLLSIARAGQPADSGDIYPVSGTTMDIVVPDSGRYSARLARVCHRDIDVQSRWSEASNFQIYNSLGIAPRHDGLSPALLIYPNPASGTVTIGCESANGTIELMDMQGRTLQQVPAGKHTLDISSLATGIYLVRLTSDKGTTVRQLHVK